MFDVAFSEIVVIAVVALIVIGPERLPKVARTLGHMFGRLQRYVNEVKADINREIELDELRKLQNQVQTAAQDFHRSVTQVAHDVQTGMRSVESQLNAGAASDTTQAPAGTPSGEGSANVAQPTSSVAPATEEAQRQATLPGIDRI